MQIQRAARYILDGKFSPRRQQPQQRESFTSAGVECAYDRVWWLRIEQNVEEEKET